jgi:hypothetical protein
MAEASGYQAGFLDVDECAARGRRVLDAALASLAADVDEARAKGRSVSGRLLEGPPGRCSNASRRVQS